MRKSKTKIVHGKNAPSFLFNNSLWYSNGRFFPWSPQMWLWWFNIVDALQKRIFDLLSPVKDSLLGTSLHMASYPSCIWLDFNFHEKNAFPADTIHLFLLGELLTPSQRRYRHYNISSKKQHLTMQFFIDFWHPEKTVFQLKPLSHQESMKTQISTYSNVIMMVAILLLLPWNQVFHGYYLS